VGEVDRRDLDPFLLDVLPDVELGPVAEGEDAEVLAPAVAPVVERPELGPLVLRVPLAELVAVGEDPLLGPRLLLVAPGSPEHGVELLRLDGVEERGGLQAVARGAGARLLGHPAGVDGRLDAGHDQTGSELGHPPVAELEDLGEVVPGVDVHQRERERGGPERLLGHPQHDDRVLAPGEQQHGALELGRHLAEDVHRLRLQGGQV